MIRVESYLKVGNDFVPIAEFKGRVKDPEYVEGAIEVEIDGVKVLTLELWDDINWLWPYIANSLEELATEQTASTSFPDQPIELIFRTDNRRQRIVVEVVIPPDEHIRTSAAYDEFMSAMSEAGQEFFRRMVGIVPENRAEYEADRLRFESVMPKAFR